MAAVSYSSPPVGIAKDVGYHACTHSQEIVTAVAITLTATELQNELTTATYLVPDGLTSAEVPFVHTIMAKAQYTSTMVGRTIRMRYCAQSFNYKIISKVPGNRILHVDPGLRNC